MKLFSTFKRGISSFQTLQQIKKFYKNVHLEPFPNAPRPEHKYLIKLDNKIVKTPNKNTLSTTTEELGLAVAAEFLVQQEYLKPPTMPLFALSRTAVDVDIDPNLRGHLETAIIDFFKTDTIWFREEKFPTLLRLQNENLNPIVAYINETLGTSMKIETGLVPPELSAKDKERLVKYLTQLNNWKLLALEYSASTLKSTSIAIALLNERVQIEEALDLSRLEENYQQTLYGIAEGDHDLDEKTAFMMVAAAKNFYNLAH